MANPTPTGAPRVPPGKDSLAAAFARLTREDLESIADTAIAEMDRRDPDTDLELNGDEADANGSEEDFINHNANWLAEPGCPVSDPGGEDTILAALPEYGEDQSLGPVNEHEGARAHMVAERGLVRTATGGWRHP